MSVIFQSQTNCGRDGAPDGVELDYPRQLGGDDDDDDDDEVMLNVLRCQLTY